MTQTVLPHETLAAAPTTSDGDPIERSRQRVTNLLAAAEILRAGFPDANLPKVYGYPFLALGHQVLFDYDRFRRVVWSVAEAVRQELLPVRRVRLMVSWTGVILALLVFLAVAAAAEDAPSVGIIPAIVVLFTSLIVSNSLGRQHLRRSFGIRADTADSLIRNDVLPVPLLAFDGISDHELLIWGKASIGGRETPVLLSTANDRFPGFGKTLIEESLVCPQKEASDGQPATSAEIDRKVIQSLENNITSAGFGGVQSGPTLLVDAGSIQWSSRLLTTDHRPRTSIPTDELQSILKQGCRAECRLYQAIMLTFPEYLTTATIFVRSNIAGHAACCDVSLTLLGPPVMGEAQLRDRLIVLRRAARKWTSKPTSEKQIEKDKSSMGTLARRLAEWKGAPRTEPSPMGLPWKLKPRDRREEEGLSAVCRDILAETDRWVGDWMQLGNPREYQSYILTPDIFGRMDVRAGVRALYLQVSETILKTLEQMGFDVSSYRDEKGNFTISAERIDSLVVGERINVRSTAAPTDQASKPEKGVK